MYKLVDGVAVPLTEEETAERAAEEAAWAAGATGRANDAIWSAVGQLEDAAQLPRHLRDVIKKDPTHGAYDKVLNLEVRIEELKIQIIKE